MASFFVPMFRYIAVASTASEARGSPQDQTISDLGRAFAKGWNELPQQRGLRVFYHDAREGSLEARALPEGAGVMLGAAFQRTHDATNDSPAPRWRASTKDARAILTTRGRWLIESCWGNYVAFVLDAQRSRLWVIKDPCGELPCFLTVLNGVTVIFSSIADLIEMRLFKFAIGRTYLAARVLLSGIAGQQPLEGVEQISRGECVEIDFEKGGPRRRQFYWHPSTFVCTSDPIEDADIAARAMRATIQSCTRAWASAHHSVIHRLSGGLDSSIIAACLQDVGDATRLCCYTYYNPRGRSDERPWARLVARRLGCQHIEWPVGPQDIELERALDMPRLVEPVPVMGYLLRRTLEQTIASEHRATAVFCGDGGDSGFGGEAFAYSLSDYLERHAFGFRALKLATQIASLTEQSTWAVVLKSVSRWRHGESMARLRNMLTLSSRLVSPSLKDAVAVPERYPHPWFSHFERVPWATIRRLGTLLSSPQCYHAGPEAPDVIAPLYAQPAIELFLRIPLYVHFEGGRERGLARRAFTGDVPAPVLQRLWKDRAPGFYDELVYRNRGFLRKMLLDGILAREGLLDRAAVERTLSDDLARDSVLPTEVFRHLDVEMWARTWTR